MKLARFVLMTAIAGGFIAAPVQAQNGGGGELITISDLAQSLRDAPTASELVEAYAKATVHAGDSAIVNRAFIMRMIDFKHPEMAEAQARSVLRMNDDGMAWAVLAYSAAMREEAEPAMLNIARAVSSSPNGDFVSQAAGEIVGWYDATNLAESASDEAKQAYAAVTDRLENRGAFNDSRDRVMTALAPPAPPRRVGGGITIIGGGLAVHSSGAGDAYFSSPLALFYDAPYLLFPSYRHYPALLPGVSYYYDYWNGGIGAPFPFGTVDRDVRYVRLPGNGYALSYPDGGSSINYSLNRYYDPYSGRFSGYYAPGWRSPNNYNNYVTTPGRPYGQLGASRLSYRMRGGAPLVNEWRYTNPPYIGTAPYRSARTPGRPSYQQPRGGGRRGR